MSYILHCILTFSSSSLLTAYQEFMSMDSTWLDTSLALSMNINSIPQYDRVLPQKPDSLCNSTEDISDHGCPHVLNSFHQKRDSDSGETLISSRNYEQQEGSEVCRDEINQLMSENRRLTEMLKAMFHHCSKLQNQVDDLKNTEIAAAVSMKRKREKDDASFTDRRGTNFKTESSSSDEAGYSPPPINKSNINESSKLKISRVYVQSNASDMSLIVKDGYHWRKYGQKVTRDNPSPRAYYRCSFAPTCSVKKRVQRSVEDASVLVATYEGEHNHNPIISQAISPAASSPTSVAAATLHLGQTEDQQRHGRELQHFLVQHMASTLTRDPNFTAALAAVVKGSRMSEKL